MRSHVTFVIVFFFCLSAAQVGVVKAEGNDLNHSDLGKQQITALALDVFFNFCLKTYGDGQEKVAQEVDKNLAVFVRDESLPEEKQSPYYQLQSNHLWLMETQFSERYIRMVFKKPNGCFVIASDIDEEAMIARFRGWILNEKKSHSDSINVVSDFSFTGTREAGSVRKGSYQVYKKNPRNVLYTVSLNTARDSDCGVPVGWLEMTPYIKPEQK